MDVFLGRLFVVMGMTVAISLGASAQQAGQQVETRLEARKVVVENGKEVLQSASAVKPGDVVEYTVTNLNKGSASVANLEATLPIPLGMELVPATVNPPGAKASTGGSQFDAMPLKRKVRGSDGRELEQEVPLRDYRSLRWYPGTLAAGATAKFSARLRVVDDRPVAAPKK